MSNLDWVAPDACTLPTSDQPLRVAEFDSFFAESLTGAVLITDAQARLELAGADLAEVSARARDLVARETSCCSFFEFEVRTSNPGPVTVDIRVPTARADVLAALVRRAETVRDSAA